MAGSLDNGSVKVLDVNDYEYIVLSKNVAEIWVSPASKMSRQEIADELRRVATYVESAE